MIMIIEDYCLIVVLVCLFALIVCFPNMFNRRCMCKLEFRSGPEDDANFGRENGDKNRMRTSFNSSCYKIANV